MNSTARHQTDGLAMQTIWLAAARVIAFAVSFMLPIVLVRLLRQAEFGVYKQVFQILSTFLGLLNLQVASSVYYFMPRKPAKKPQVAMNVLLFYGLLGTVVALVFAFFPRWVTIIFKGNELVPVMPILGVAILLWLVSTGLEGFMLVNGDSRLVSGVVVLIQLTKTLLLVAASGLFGGIRSIVIAAVVQGALQCAIVFLYLRRRFGRFWQSLDWVLFKAQLANSLPFGIGGVLVALQFDLHSYFVSHYFDAAHFAIYAVGCSHLAPLAIFVASAESVLYPEISRLGTEQAYQPVIRVWMNTIRAIAFWSIPGCTLMFILRRDIVMTLFTQDYIGAVPIFAINLVNILLWTVITLPFVRAFAEFRYFRLKLYLVLLPLTWLVLYFSVQAWGLIGAAIAVVFIQLLDTAITAIMIHRRLAIRLNDVKSLAPVMRIMAATAVAGVLTTFIRETLLNARAIIALAICFAVFGLVYLAAAFVLGGITDHEKSKLHSLLRTWCRMGFSRLGVSASDV